ncbi:LysR family transcriptional regulator [Photobacterium aquae]|uniref:LysR family transcriptional regulator n=1 Tax=Photobacterium aquae TaxID=1195763 RepID=A0A0J1H123_9GAMM|nr:LysR family transcriptional regulator [Photobacterium aquae]KLV05518.1 LysR family transcriptional regulator [Photobacterium aquae]
MDRITSMEIFVRSVELGSFAAVADEFGISAQMVGKHVRSLEASLGAKLLVKSTRFQSLTAAGEQYYQRCLTILAELKAAQEDIYRNMNEPCGKLKIYAGVNVGIKALSPALARFIEQYPRLEIELILDNNQPDIKKEGYDIIFRDRVDGYEYLIANKLRSFEMVVCASPEYLAKYGVPSHPMELENHQCLQPSGLNSAYKWCFYHGRQSFSPLVSSRLTMNSGQAMMAAALEGAGITMQPIFQVREALSTGKLIQILTDYKLPEIELFMLYKPSLRNTARLTLISAFLKDALSRVSNE